MIHVTLSPLHAQQVQALLRPTATDGQPVSPAAAALDAAAGAGWVDRALADADLPLGSAVITDAGDLSVEFVVHVVLRSPDEPVSGRTVSEALMNGLRRCAEWGLSEVAAPLLGTGPGNLEPSSACAMMEPAVSDFLQGGERTVTICAADEFERNSALAWVKSIRDG